jgi:hypothetical protein
MARVQAAMAGAIGREILTLPLLAGRLAGGFTTPAGTDVLYPAIQAALAEGGFQDIAGVSGLPGTPRAVLQSLDSVWRADVDLLPRATEAARFHDLALIEARIRDRIPATHMLPRDLRAAAVERADRASRLLGPVTLIGIADVDPVWRPLVNAIARNTELSWDMPPGVERPWFEGVVYKRKASGLPQTIAEACADPKSEVVESLRWVRRLLSAGDIKAQDIAIAATSTQDWDDHFLAYAKIAALPIHFSHGVPALSTADGQACAALADVLANGLSQERIWRLVRRLPTRPFVALLPPDWFSGIPRGAALRTVEHWRQALAAAGPQRTSPEPAEQILLPILDILARGPEAASEAGKRLLSGASLAMWEDALRSAPAHAIGLSLQSLRVADQREPANSVVWCPASQLASCPRPFTRLLGFTSGSWPRSDHDDPLIPDHLLERSTLHPVSLADRDRLHFEIIRTQTREELVLSRSQRNARGGLLSSSALWPGDSVLHARDRVPEHAFSDADRLLARPRDAGQLAHVRQAQTCWRDWQWREELTAHDGLVNAHHPAIEAALARVQSTTSLQRLLRDPLGFVWRYALGWHAARHEPEPLQLDPTAFGELVHELISGTIAALEPMPGFARASAAEIDTAIEGASETVLRAWPLQRSVPPTILWRHTVKEAARRTAKGLASDDQVRSDTQSWTEVPFGRNDAVAERAPWNTATVVPIESTGLIFGGRMDRLDLRATGDAARITDYKSTKPPPKKQRIILGQGRELQRVLYAIAVRSLLPDVRAVVARLIYLADDPATFELKGDELTDAIDNAINYISAATAILRGGRIAPRWERDAFYDDMRLALPADRESYLRRKTSDFRAANQQLNRLWGSST